MNIFAGGLEREIQQFDWFLSGLEVIVQTRVSVLPLISKYRQAS